VGSYLFLVGQALTIQGATQKFDCPLCSSCVFCRSAVHSIVAITRYYKWTALQLTHWPFYCVKTSPDKYFLMCWLCLGTPRQIYWCCVIIALWCKSVCYAAPFLVVDKTKKIYSDYKLATKRKISSFMPLTMHLTVNFFFFFCWLV